MMHTATSTETLNRSSTGQILYSDAISGHEVFINPGRGGVSIDLNRPERHHTVSFSMPADAFNAWVGYAGSDHHVCRILAREGIDGMYRKIEEALR